MQSEPDDLTGSFDEIIANQFGGKLTLEGGEPCDCVLPDGLDQQSEEANGRWRGRVSALVLVKRSDIGDRLPRTGRGATLEYTGDTYSKLTVAEDDSSNIRGQLFSFTVAG